MPFDGDTGNRLPLGALRGRAVNWKVVELWPPAIESFISRQRIAVRAPHPSETYGDLRDPRPLRITSPISREVFCRLGAIGPATDQIALSVATDSASGKLYWFVDTDLFRECRPGQAIFWPLKEGQFLITCSDDLGRSDSVRIKVE
jgi:membrane carboxypeptidase/penicillin-binding protein PbpC